MPPLPLLRLPQLVLCEIFKSLSIGEKIKLSLCSKKISTQINNAQFYSQKVLVDLDILNQNIRVHSENDEDIFEIFTYPESEISRNSNTEQCSIACCLLKIFQCKISTNISQYNSDLYQPTISMLFDLQVEFKKLTISLDGSEDQNLFNQISNKLGLVEDLQISPGWLPGFKPIFISWPQKITIWSSYWFTLEHILACTCTTIILEMSHLGNKDADVILRKWKAGGFPYLEYLSVEGESISNGRILGMYWMELQGMVIHTDDGL
ncbi:hypothetical protein CRE_22013 [Caenorhabditis remanei]|uniref:F-box domain-containing protein n=1 Tax=Caenorhabditis remanei TaxID=31234 RepID=E3N3D8_CAERE|nr:hypothetical protein CRE_22013 [Caenorhabditis remanei]